MEKRILIVEDKDKGIEFVSSVLEENAYMPISAADGIEGMEKVKTERPDLILSSNPSLSPLLSAYEVARSFRAHPFRICV